MADELKIRQRASWKSEHPVEEKGIFLEEGQVVMDEVRLKSLEQHLAIG